MQKKILVVDDDPLYLELVKDVFVAQDIEIFVAPNGVGALTLLKTLRPSMIISDFDMPEMNGVELHARLSHDQKTKAIPFVFMTGSADITLHRYAREHGLGLFNKNNLVKELLLLSKDLK